MSDTWTTLDADVEYIRPDYIELHRVISQQPVVVDVQAIDFVEPTTYTGGGDNERRDATLVVMGQHGISVSESYDELCALLLGPAVVDLPGDKPHEHAPDDGVEDWPSRLREHLAYAHNVNAAWAETKQIGRLREAHRELHARAEEKGERVRMAPKSTLTVNVVEPVRERDAATDKPGLPFDLDPNDPLVPPIPTKPPLLRPDEKQAHWAFTGTVETGTIDFCYCERFATRMDHDDIGPVELLQNYDPPTIENALEIQAFRTTEHHRTDGRMISEMGALGVLAFITRGGRIFRNQAYSAQDKPLWPFTFAGIPNAIPDWYRKGASSPGEVAVDTDNPVNHSHTTVNPPHMDDVWYRGHLTQMHGDGQLEVASMSSAALRRYHNAAHRKRAIRDEPQA